MPLRTGMTKSLCHIMGWVILSIMQWVWCVLFVAVRHKYLIFLSRIWKCAATFFFCFHFSSFHFSSYTHCFSFSAVRPFSIFFVFHWCFSFFLLPLYVSFLYLMCTSSSNINSLAPRDIRDDLPFWRCNIRTTFETVLTLGYSRPCVFWRMYQLFAMRVMVGCETLGAWHGLRVSYAQRQLLRVSWLAKCQSVCIKVSAMWRFLCW